MVTVEFTYEQLVTAINATPNTVEGIRVCGTLVQATRALDFPVKVKLNEFEHRYLEQHNIIA